MQSPNQDTYIEYKYKKSTNQENLQSHIYYRNHFLF